LVFPPNSLEAGSYNVTLYAENWYGSSDSASATFVVFTVPVPTVSVTPVTKTLRTEPVTVVATAAVSDCGPETNLTYAWTSEQGVPDGVDTTQSTLVIPANTLDANTNYYWTVTVTTGDGLSNTADTVIAVGFQIPSLSIAELITVGVGVPAPLLVFYQYADYPGEVPTVLWTCNTCGVGSFTSADEVFTYLNNLAVGEFDVTVALTWASFGTLSATVTVVVVPGSPPLVIGFNFEFDGVIDYSPYIPVDSRSVVKPFGDDGDNLALVDSWFWTISPEVDGLNVNERNLFIPPETLTPFTRYTFTLYSTQGEATSKVVQSRLGN
jgi:hypothetical protein